MSLCPHGTPGGEQFCVMCLRSLCDAAEKERDFFDGERMKVVEQLTAVEAALEVAREALGVIAIGGGNVLDVEVARAALTRLPPHGEHGGGR